jgi:hypothetical protein
VEGLACETKEVEGLFSKTSTIDWYEAILTRGPGGYGSSTSDRTTCVHAAAYAP